MHEGADDTNVLRLKSEVSGGGGGTQRMLCLEGKVDKHYDDPDIADFTPGAHIYPPGA